MDVKKYGWALLPQRIQDFRVSKCDGSKGVILMYHEVLPDSNDIDAWTVVKESEFRKQMTFLKQNFSILTMDQVCEEKGEGDKPYAVVTFDDGYRGNFTTVLPIIEEMKIPITVYVATDALIKQGKFWYDWVIEIFLHQDVKEVNLVSFGLQKYMFPSSQSIGRRWEKVQQLLTDLKTLDPTKRDIVVTWVRDKFKDLKGLDQLNLMSHEQVAKLSQSPFVTIGGHSHCHNLLTQLSDSKVGESVSTNKALLESWTGKEVNHFAYPNGNYNESVISLISDAGFKSAVTTVKNPTSNRDNQYLLPRLGVGRFDSLRRFSSQLVDLVK